MTTWLGISKEQIKSELEARFGVGKPAAPGLADKIDVLSDQLREEFRAFWQNGTPTADVTIGDFSLLGLINNRGMTPVGAFAALDWLIRDPVAASKTLSRKMSGYIPSRSIKN